MPKAESAALIADRPEPKEVAPGKQQRLMSCCSSPRPSCELPVKKAVLVRSPKKPDAAPRARRAHDQITCQEAAAAGLGLRLGERPRKDIASRREEKAAARARANLVCCCPLCFLCLLLSDDNQTLAFINAVYSKRNREGTSSNCSRRTKKARQQHQQRQHLYADTQSKCSSSSSSSSK